MTEALAQKIIAAFNASAATYDEATPLQRAVAKNLTARVAAKLARPPRKIVDLGAGAGHVVEAAKAFWPEAKIVALDAAPAMLDALRAKYPDVTTICADARDFSLDEAPDLILSSMMLHWLDAPRVALENWRRKLAPGGALGVALPVEGTFDEWRAFLRAHGLEDGLWDFPPENFAENLGFDVEIARFSQNFGGVKNFLTSLKKSGAHKNRRGAKNLSAATLRRLMAEKPENFVASFRVAFLLTPYTGSH